MEIFNIYGNKILLINYFLRFDNQIIIDKLINQKLDTAIVYKKIDNKTFYIDIIEKDGTISNMCGNGCIALANKFKNDFTNIILINNFNHKIEIEIINSKIIFSLPIIHKLYDLFYVSDNLIKYSSFKNIIKHFILN